MVAALDLGSLGLRLYAGRLYNHDYLWFSSLEISKTAATLPMIHNYALSYAISGYSYGIYVGSTPRYATDLDTMPAYATPARPLGGMSRTRFTQNAVNSRTLRTDDAPRHVNSPSLGWRLVLDLAWGDEGPNGSSAGFDLYLFARSAFSPPAVARLGKKGCPIRFLWTEISAPVARFVEEAVQPTHAVNPLDIQGELVACEPVPIPPHLVLRVAEIRRDWFVFAEGHRVHVPRRLTLAGPLQLGRASGAETPTRAADARRKRGG
jgi:CRISPR-associated protein Csc1